VELLAPPQDDLQRWRPTVPSGHPRHPIRSSDAAAVWNGVVWGRLGRCDHAWAWWDSVTAPDLQPWIAGERGRLLRELGLHDRATVLEEEGLRDATDLVDVVLLRLSLAADAVGLGQEAAARRALGTAGALLDELPVGDRVRRQRLRRVWIGVEVDLLAGAGPDADGLPSMGPEGPVFPIDHRAGTDFHRAKGLLFGGIVRDDTRLLAAAAPLAPPMLRWAVELARADRGEQDAGPRAATAWHKVVPPPGVERAVAATATARRLESLGSRRR
jgi:hypothetical protein